MEKLTLQECADYLEGANIDNSIDRGFDVLHTGLSSEGKRFVLINDCCGETYLGEY